jgi:copper transport protein
MMVSAVAAVAIAVAVGWAGVAYAHAEFVASDPAPDSVLDDSPDAIVLTFSERVDAPDDAIRLLDAAGQVVDTSTPRRGPGDDTISIGIVGDLDGSYVVSWRAVSADSHPISGAFTFAVGARSELAPGLIDDTASSAGDTAVPNFWLALSRMVSFGSIAMLVGGFVVLARCDASLLPTSRAVRMLAGSAVTGAVATASMIASQASIIGRGPLHLAAWSAVAESLAGRWWFIRLGLLIVIGALAVMFRPILDRRTTQYAAAALALLLLAVVAAGGHATTGRFTTMAFVATVVHLGAMAVWVGGLAAIVIVAGSRVANLLTRFSPLAFGSVVLLALTGTFNGWRQIGNVSGLLDSSYGRWLIVKVGFVIAVVVVAYVSRRALAAVPEYGAPGGGTSGGDASEGGALRRTVRIELAGMVAILAATSGLVNAPPAISADISQPIPVTVTADSGLQRAQIDLFPATTGGTTMNVTIYPASGASADPMADPVADEIRVTASLAEQQLGPIDIASTIAPSNSLSTDDALFPLPGRWEITVRARYGVFDEIVFTQTVEIR